jgi:hypothetical protein
MGLSIATLMMATIIGLDGLVDHPAPLISPVAFNQSEANLQPLPATTEQRALCVTETLIYWASRDEPTGASTSELRRNMEKACAISTYERSFLRELRLKQDRQ